MRPGPSSLRAVALMALATIAFTGMHAMIRHVAVGLHPFEVAFWRNLLGLLLIAPYFVRYGLAPLRTARLSLHALRGAFNLVSMLCFFYALTVTPLTEITALTFTAPIFAAALAVPILGERVGALRWAAIACGFAGALVILRPGFTTVGAGPVLALIAAVLWAFALLAIKSLARTESSITITAWMMIMLAPLSLVAALPFWRWPDPGQYLWLVALAGLGTAGHLLMNQALKEGDTSLVAPVDFVRLIWAAAIGFLAFGEVPDGFTWLGGAMICASAALIAYRERRRGATIRRGQIKGDRA